MAISKIIIRLTLSTLIFLMGTLLFIGCDNKPQTSGTAHWDIVDVLPVGIAQPLKINYDNKINLVGITIIKLSSEELMVFYFWQPLQELGAFDKVFVHFTDANNNILFQNDHSLDPSWSSKKSHGKYIREMQRVKIDKGPEVKDCYVKVGIFAPDLSGWPRLKITTSGGMAIDESSMSAIVDHFIF